MNIDEVRALYEQVKREHPDLWEKDPNGAILAHVVGRVVHLEGRFARLLHGARTLAGEVKALRDGGGRAGPPPPAEANEADDSPSRASPPVASGAVPFTPEQAAIEAEMDAAIANGSPTPGENVPQPPVGRTASSSSKGNSRAPAPK